MSGFWSSPAQVRRLLIRAGVEDLNPATAHDAVAAAVAGAVDGGRIVTLRMGPTKRPLHLLGATLFALVIGVAIVLARILGYPWLAAVCAAGVGPFMFFHLLVALPRSDGLTLGYRGIRVRYAFRDRTWNWSEINNFAATRSSTDGPTRVRFTSTRPEDTDTPGLLEWLGVRGLTLTTQLPDRYGLDPRDLATLLHRCRTACAPRTAAAPAREVGSPAAARFLTACGGSAALLAFSWFAVLWVAPTDPVPVLVICAITAAVFGILYAILRSRQPTARPDAPARNQHTSEIRTGPRWTPQTRRPERGSGAHRQGRSRRR